MTAAVFQSETTVGANMTQDACNYSQSCIQIDDFKYQAYTFTYSIVFPFGFISNCVALYIFLCYKKKNPNTVFMINLALSDIGFSLTLPFRLIYYFQGSEWGFSDWLCRWCMFSFYLNLYTSILFLTGLSVLRYFAVVHSVQNKIIVTVRRASLSCLGIWIFVAILSTPFLMSGTIKRGDKMRCFEPKNSKSWKQIFILNYFGLFFGFIIPFFTILVCYGCIIRKLVNVRQIKSHRRKSRERPFYLIGVVLSSFLLCFLPYHIVRTVHLHSKVSCKSCQVIEFHLKFLIISLCMAASNCCFNPFIYYFAGENFRKAIHQKSFRATLIQFNQREFYPSSRRPR